ncbi:D-3-phosphoglycerate dehydrogenase [Gibbsiella quercinecans]|uniref:Hydroxyacid dehydrogenase n=1 Tax=Gibbsiella quercinecans TaxID=929813 RepID=A0A250AZ50_9GAMM|nr:hydroxyacid dehydrogenase [Gibbsiella quercinecans]ATA19105.1 hydroxyacid dehydrogenase [Gibbsiella quercinecans]RLM02792.1 hydroxyacid dehydrogenase [Gibbsiella quercinecans]RLM07764.1 hydroxyacid dehydrogenase [Gibbsiella quercinecans]TCT80366.1 D-3-phosphoglycerate dehydrogenase [Gibbsiella quercinecans]
MKNSCWIPKPIHQFGINRLKNANLSPLEQSEDLDTAAQAGVVAAIFRSGEFSRTMMAQLPHLRVIAVHGVGTDGIDLQAATEKGIVVINTPGMNTRSVAEHAIGLMFALAKRQVAADNAVRQGAYQAFKYQSGLRELQHAVLGIVGLGATGRCTAALANALGMQVVVYSSQQDAVIRAAGYCKAADLAGLLRQSDIVSLHVPSLPATRHLIGARQLAQMKPSAYLINTSRGALIDEAALISALNNGALAGARLDVFEQEPLPAGAALLTARNLVVSPHIAASTEQALINMAGAAVEGILRVLRDEKPDSLVNPAVWPTRRR